jgi:biotin carboxyl carrier protein
MRRYTIEVGGKTFALDVRELASDRFEVTLDGQRHDVVVGQDIEITPASGSGKSAKSVELLPIAQAANSSHAELTAPLPGVIASIDVAPGTRVERGDSLLTIEAMKMRNSIRAPRSAIVSEIVVSVGEQVGHGDVLVRFGDES